MSGDWTLRARTAALAGSDVIGDWTGTLVERFNLPDTLQVNGRTDDLRPLFALDGGVTLNDADGRRFSGLLSNLERTGDDTCSVTFESDLARLWDRIIYPDPAHAWNAQTLGYDVQTSVAAETAALHYIDKNAGPGAIVARRTAGLTVPTSLGRGGTVTITPERFKTLGVQVNEIAETADLRFRILQSGTTLAVTVDAVADLSATARFGTNAAGGPGLIGPDWTYTIRRPDLTQAEVGGEGDLAARILRERPGTAAQALWGRRIEGFVDQNNTSVTAELDKAGDDALAEGAQPVEINATLLDSPDLPLSDVPIGSLVALDLDGELVVDRLRQITTTFGGSDGPTLSVTGLVGSADAGLTRTQKDFLAMRKAIRKVTSQ